MQQKPTLTSRPGDDQTQAASGRVNTLRLLFLRVAANLCQGVSN
jgi:hypothetical protein